MGKDFPFKGFEREAPQVTGDPGAAERLAERDIAVDGHDKRNMKVSHGDPTRKGTLSSRRVKGGENFDAAASVDAANSVLERLAERGVIELHEDEDAGEPASE